MKKIILIMTILISIISCQKEDVIENSNGSEIINNKRQEMVTWFDDGGPEIDINYGCSGPPTNCFPDCPVGPIIFNGFDIIEEGNNEDITTFFHNNYSELTGFINENLVSQVSEGNYTVKAKGSFPGKRFMLFTDANGKLKRVCEFIE